MIGVTQAVDVRVMRCVREEMMDRMCDSSEREVRSRARGGMKTYYSME